MHMRLVNLLGLAAALTGCSGDVTEGGGPDVGTTSGGAATSETTSSSTHGSTSGGTHGSTHGSADGLETSTTTEPDSSTAGSDTRGDSDTGSTDTGLAETTGEETGSIEICEGVQDPCAVCVCTECEEELAACEADEGCKAIRECVQTMGLAACEDVILMHLGSAETAQALGVCAEGECPICGGG